MTPHLAQYYQLLANTTRPFTFLCYPICYSTTNHYFHFLTVHLQTFSFYRELHQYHVYIQ